MQKLDTIGRITIPKHIRERNNFKTNDLFEIYEQGDDIILSPLAKNYSISESQMMTIRKVYMMLKDTDILEDSELETLKDICKFTDVVCPNCNENLYLTSDNSYKCMKCGD